MRTTSASGKPASAASAEPKAPTHRYPARAADQEAQALADPGWSSTTATRMASDTGPSRQCAHQGWSLAFQNFDLAGAYAASALLALIALTTLFAMSLIGDRRSET